jgi:hypothetical protein
MTGSTMDESGLAGRGAGRLLISAEREGCVAPPDRSWPRPASTPDVKASPWRHGARKHGKPNTPLLQRSMRGIIMVTRSLFSETARRPCMPRQLPLACPRLFSSFFSLSAMLPCLLPNHRILANAPRGAAWGCLPEQGGGMGLGGVCIVWRGGRVVLGWR